MELVIDIPKNLYANLQKIQNGSIAAKRILECVRNGKSVMYYPQVEGITPTVVEPNRVKTELKTELDELDCVSRQYLIEKAVSWDKHFADSIRYVALTDILNAPSVNPNLQMLCKFCVENGQPQPCPCDYYKLLKRKEVQDENTD